MSYSSVVVCLDNGAASEKRLNFAIEFAVQFNAHLTGVHTTYGPLVSYDPYGQMTSIAADWEATVLEKQKKAEAQFSAKADKAGINCDWNNYRSTELSLVTARARASDIAIVGQVDPANNENDVDNSFYEHFTLGLGRPVLFLPYKNQYSAKFETIIVAWDGGRESARAIADAMPLLEAAKLVHVVTITLKKNQENEIPDVDIAAFLTRHGVNVEIEKAENISTDTADWLLSRATDVKADLLVMGAYGHNRLAELILGGTTRMIMRKMTLPVLMSH